MQDSNAGALNGCLDVCRRCRSVVERATTANPPAEAFALLGPHLRHCLDHFVALLEGVETGRIDYDARARDAEIERNPEKALALLDAIVARLEALRSESRGRRVDVIQLGGANEAPSIVPSSLERELLFLSSHTVHHLAIMVELARARNWPLPEEFGVAFSTARHRERVAAGTA